MDQPMIGIMLNDRTFNGIREGKTKHEAVRLYEHAARRLNCRLCYFRLRDISVKHMQVRALLPKGQGDGYSAVRITLPKVVHNRAIHLKRKARQKLTRLRNKGVFIYNGQTRYSKLFVHRLLLQNDRIRQHLPETYKASPASIRKMMSRYDSLILKPNNGSIGRGIMLLQKQGDAWALTYRSSKQARRWVTVSFRSVLPGVLRRKIRAKTYLVQQFVPLATYTNRPFDLRVSVQKDGSGIWAVTGIVGKAAPARMFLTNVAQGGTVHTLDHLLHGNTSLDSPMIRNHVEQLALRIADHLGRHLPNLADLGLDIGVTEHGFPVFIECNFRDLRYSFQKGGLLKEFQSVYYRPISYGQRVWLSKQVFDPRKG